MRQVKRFSLWLIVGLWLITGGVIQRAEAISATPSVIKLSIKPGETQNGAIDINNAQDKDVFVKVGLKDWIIDNGERKFAESGKNPRSLTNWLIIDPEGFALGAKKTQKVRYSVKVPADAKGGYWGLIMFRSQPLGPSTGVMVAMEVVAFISVEVEQTAKKAISINEILASNNKEKGLSLKAKLKNIGNTPIFQPAPLGSFKIKDASGKALAEGELTGGMVLPGEVAEYYNKEPVKVPEGDYDAIIAFDYGSPKLIGKKVPLTSKIGYDWRTLFKTPVSTSHTKGESQ